MFQPQSKNKKNISMPWQLVICIFLGVWPLKDSVSKRTMFSYYGYGLLFVTIYYIHIEAELRFLMYNISNIFLLTDVLMSNAAGLQILISCCSQMWTREKFKKFLKRFYDYIYIDETEKKNSSFHGFIRNALLPMILSNYATICAVIMFAVEPIITLYFLNDDSHDPRPLPFPQIYLFSLENLYVYGIVLFLNEVIAISAGCAYASYSYLVYLIITHATGRYKELNKNIENLLTDIETDLNFNDLRFIQKCNAKLNFYLREHCKLKKFVDEIQDNFELLIFLIISIDTVMISLGAFKFASSNDGFGISFVKSSAYTAAIIIRILLLGNMGSTLNDESQKTKTALYCCGWETLLCSSQSNNCEIAKEKVKFNKSLLIALICSQESRQLRGFFDNFCLSMQTAVEVIRKGISFYMILTAFE